MRDFVQKDHCKRMGETFATGKTANFGPKFRDLGEAEELSHDSVNKHLVLTHQWGQDSSVNHF